jgi:hypothetical protein
MKDENSNIELGRNPYHIKQKGYIYYEGRIYKRWEFWLPAYFAVVPSVLALLLTLYRL